MLSNVMIAFCLLGAISSHAALPHAALAGTDASDQPLAIVGGETLTTTDLDAEISATLSGATGVERPALDPDGVLQRLVQNRLLEQEGYRIGADQLPVVRNQIREFIRLKSVQALLDSVSTSAPGTIAESPESLVGQVGLSRRYSHILVKDETLAAALEESLSAGVPFSDLAKRHSLDDTARQGGDLGWAAAGAYVDAFEAAGAGLSLNEIAGPVRTEFGWHLITLTGSKADTLKSEAMAKAVVQAREGARRSALAESYVESLKAMYHVSTDDSLLASLDYASADPEVQQELQSSQAVLAVLPTGKLTVRGLTRNIRFQYFHGLKDRPDAAQIRDRMFQEWVAEGLLSYEAGRLGFDRAPDLLLKASREERRLIREEVLKHVLDVEFKPSEEEVRAFYEANRNDYIPAPRIKVQSVLARDADTARRLRAEMDAGAGLKWLASRSASEVDSTPPFPTDWIPVEMVGLEEEQAVEGVAIGPLDLPAGWAVAEIVGVERLGPAPLETCSEQVHRAMKGTRLRKAIQEALSRLESATEIQIQQGAKEVVAERLERMNAHLSQGGTR
jgi:peptidyl-prolyl cis-trans isomerase C